MRPFQDIKFKVHKTINVFVSLNNKFKKWKVAFLL